jgi:hypothetical protein
MAKKYPKMVFNPRTGRRQHFFPGKLIRDRGGQVFLAAHEEVSWRPRRRPRGHQFPWVIKFLGDEIDRNTYGHC